MRNKKILRYFLWKISLFKKLISEKKSFNQIKRSHKIRQNVNAPTSHTPYHHLLHFHSTHIFYKVIGFNLNSFPDSPYPPKRIQVCYISRTKIHYFKKCTHLPYLFFYASQILFLIHFWFPIELMNKKWVASSWKYRRGGGAGWTGTEQKYKVHWGFGLQVLTKSLCKGWY